MCTGAVSAQWLIWLGGRLSKYVGLFGCWQIRKSQITLKSLTPLQRHGEEGCLAFEEMNTDTELRRILSTQICFAHSCLTRGEAALLHQFYFFERQKLEAGVIIFFFSLG